MSTVKDSNNMACSISSATQTQHVAPSTNTPTQKTNKPAESATKTDSVHLSETAQAALKARRGGD